MATLAFHSHQMLPMGKKAGTSAIAKSETVSSSNKEAKVLADGQKDKDDCTDLGPSAHPEKGANNKADRNGHHNIPQVVSRKSSSEDGLNGIPQKTTNDTGFNKERRGSVSKSVETTNGHTPLEPTTPAKDTPDNSTQQNAFSANKDPESKESKSTASSISPVDTTSNSTPQSPDTNRATPKRKRTNSDDHNSRQGEEGAHEEDNTALADDEDEGN